MRAKSAPPSFIHFDPVSLHRSATRSPHHPTCPSGRVKTSRPSKLGLSNRLARTVAGRATKMTTTIQRVTGSIPRYGKRSSHTDDRWQTLLPPTAISQLSRCRFPASTSRVGRQDAVHYGTSPVRGTTGAACKCYIRLSACCDGRAGRRGRCRSSRSPGPPKCRRRRRHGLR